MRRQRGKRLYDSVELGQCLHSLQNGWIIVIIEHVEPFLNISLADLLKWYFFSLEIRLNHTISGYTDRCHCMVKSFRVLFMP